MARSRANPRGAAVFSCPLIVLSMGTDRGERRAFCVERRKVWVRPDRSEMARRAGRAVRRGTRNRSGKAPPPGPPAHARPACATCMCDAACATARRAASACRARARCCRSARAHGARGKRRRRRDHQHTTTTTPRARACVRTCVRELRSKGATRLVRCNPARSCCLASRWNSPRPYLRREGRAPCHCHEDPLDMASWKI